MTVASSELEELRASLRKALRTPPPHVAPVLDPQWRPTWPQLAELGIGALCISEASGGFGLHVAAAATAAVELGIALHAGPFAAATAAALLIDRARERESCSEIVSGIASGLTVATLAVLDRGTVIGAGARVQVDGMSTLLVAGDATDHFVVLAPDLAAAALVSRDDCRLDASRHNLDVSRTMVDARFDAVTGTRLTCDPATVTLALAMHDLLVAADSLGGLQRSLERTVLHARDRVAFGRPIGGFQAVQHRLVDHTVRVRGLALMVEAAAEDLATTGDPRRTLLARSAVARHAVHVLHDLLQLTGAIGFTWEHGLHFYERRAHLDARITHDPRRALAAIARNVFAEE